MINSLIVVVRPNVEPDIRPPKQPLVFETEDPTDLEIIGNSGRCVNLDHSQNYSVTFQEEAVEQFRIYDRVRVTNPKKVPRSALDTPKGEEPKGLKNYVDLECMHYVQYLSQFGVFIVERFKKQQHSPRDGIFVMQEDLKRAVAPGEGI